MEIATIVMYGALPTKANAGSRLLYASSPVHNIPYVATVVETSRRSARRRASLVLLINRCSRDIIVVSWLRLICGNGCLPATAAALERFWAAPSCHGTDYYRRDVQPTRSRSDC